MTNQPNRDWYAATPKLKELRDSVLFGDVWERPQMSKHDRSLITVAAMLALRGMDEMRAHMARALDNGVTPEELSELCTHLAFYCGWSAGVNGGRVLLELAEERGIDLNV